jgi:flagellar assembly factor FliW
MKTVRTEAPQAPPAGAPLTLKFPSGILGFDHIREFTLHPAAPDSPYLWLEISGQPGRGFVVMSPVSSLPNYAPDVCQPDVELLGLKSPDDAFVLNIVHIGPRGEATVNLRGPLIINRHTLTGKQCVPANVSTFNQQHPLQTSRAAAA